MYIDANDNYEFNSRERFARFSVFNSSVAKGSAVGVVGTWGPWHTPLQWQPTPLPAFPQSLSSLSTRGSRGLSVRSFRSFVRSSVSSSACTGVCYPTFFATGPLYIASSLCLFYPRESIQSERIAL